MDPIPAPSSTPALESTDAARRFGEDAVELTRLLFYYDAQHDPRLWDHVTDDVVFIGPLPGQVVFGKEAYRYSIRDDLEYWYDLYEEEYHLVYSDGTTALVMGSYLLQSREDEQVFIMVRQRVSMFYVNIDGRPMLRHAHVSDPDNLNQEGETFPYNLGHELREMIDRMKANAVHDAMTGLNNRNFLEQNADTFNGLMQKSGKGLVMYFDLNGFKQVNDTRGHDTGDFLIISFSQALRHVLLTILPQAICVRTGGDEFVFIDTTTSSLSVVGYIVRALKEEFASRIARVSPGVTFSAGFARIRMGRYLPVRELISISDMRMLRCKRHLKGGR